jgi:hypothetical protein
MKAVNQPNTPRKAPHVVAEFAAFVTSQHFLARTSGQNSQNLLSYSNLSVLEILRCCVIRQRKLIIEQQNSIYLWVKRHQDRILLQSKFFVYICKFVTSLLLLLLLLLLLEPGKLTIVTTIGAGRPGFDSRQRQGFFSSPLRPNRLWGNPASYPMRTVGSFSGDRAAEEWSRPLTSIKCRS